MIAIFGVGVLAFRHFLTKFNYVFFVVGNNATMVNK
jgi:hypothetical protein